MTDAAYVLADVPVDVAKLSGKVFTADVHTALPSHRRKRNEIALTIDGHGVSIYDARQSKRLTSYAVSPQSNFTCPPCSFYLRDKARQHSRATYCSLQSHKPRIILFSELCDGPSRTLAKTATYTIDLESHHAPIVHLEIINAIDEEDGSLRRQLIAVHKDGLIECFSEHLDRRIWSSKASLANTHQTQLAALTNKHQAKKGLLKSREDVLSSLSGNLDEDDTPLLVLLNRGPSTRASRLQLQIYAVEPPHSGNYALGNTHNLQKIANFDLPQPVDLDNEDSDFTLHVSSGFLYQRDPKCVIIYGLSGLVPKVVHKISQQSTPFGSLLRVNAHIIAVSTSTSVSTIGLEFCSVLAEQQLKSKSDTGHDKNDNRAGNNAQTSVRLLSYISPLDLIVALSGTQLIALNLPNTHSTIEGSRKRKLGNLLVDAVGRGLAKRELENFRATIDHQNTALLGTCSFPDQDDIWIQKRHSLDQEFQKGRYEAFEEMIMSEFAKEGQKPEIIAQYKLSYVFGKLFTVTKEESNDLHEASKKPYLRINILPRQLFGFLARKGLFTLDQVDSALKQNGSLQQTGRLLAKPFVDALAAYDTTLSILQELVSCPVALSIQELVHVLAHIIQNWTRGQSLQGPELLAITELPHSSMIDQQPSIARSASEDTFQLLHLVLERLSRHSQSTLTQTLQYHLSRSQLISCIDILRLDLARSGWLYNHDQNQIMPPLMCSPLSNPAMANTISASLSNTIHLLSACLDSLNAAGWILGSGALSTDLTDPADTIAFMRAEVSAALEGIEEAVYLSGLLEEVLLCGRNHFPPVSREGQDEEQGLALTVALQHSEQHGHQASSIVPVPPSGGTEYGLGAALPLGLKLEEKVSLTKVGAGGELIKRSRRDIGRMKSRQVGKYSFERIMV